MNTRTYTLASNEVYGWHTGRTNDGHQALLGLDINAEVCVLFDLDGRRVHTIERCFDRDGTPVAAPITNWPFHLTDSGRKRVNDRFRCWRHEIIVSEQAIVVEEFDVAGRHIGIEPMPSDYVDFLDDPCTVAEDQRVEFRELIDDWKAAGLYVFWWNEDYYMNLDGSVNSH